MDDKNLFEIREGTAPDPGLLTSRSGAAVFLD